MHDDVVPSRQVGVTAAVVVVLVIDPDNGRRRTAGKHLTLQRQSQQTAICVSCGRVIRCFRSSQLRTQRPIRGKVALAYGGYVVVGAVAQHRSRRLSGFIRYSHTCNSRWAAGRRLLPVDDLLREDSWRRRCCVLHAHFREQAIVPLAGVLDRVTLGDSVVGSGHSRNGLSRVFGDCELVLGYAAGSAAGPIVLTRRERRRVG